MVRELAGVTSIAATGSQLGCGNASAGISATSPRVVLEAAMGTRREPVPAREFDGLMRQTFFSPVRLHVDVIQVPSLMQRLNAGSQSADCLPSRVRMAWHWSLAELQVVLPVFWQPWAKETVEEKAPIESPRAKPSSDFMMVAPHTVRSARPIG